MKFWTFTQTKFTDKGNKYFLY